MKQATLQVNGMSCQHCVSAIEKAVREVGAMASVDLSSRSVSVEYDENQVNLDTVKEAIEDQGYEVA